MWTEKNYSKQIEQKMTLLDQILDTPAQSRKFLDCESRNFQEVEEEENSTMNYDSDPTLENLIWQVMFEDSPNHRYNPQFALLPRPTTLP